MDQENLRLQESLRRTNGITVKSEDDVEVIEAFVEATMMVLVNSRSC